MERVAGLLEPGNLEPLTLGALWRLCERLHFVRDNVDPVLLSVDVRAHPDAAALWGAFVEREREVKTSLETSSERVAHRAARAH